MVAAFVLSWVTFEEARGEGDDEAEEYSLWGGGGATVLFRSLDNVMIVICDLVIKRPWRLTLAGTLIPGWRVVIDKKRKLLFF